jgi:hypothetical protein
MRNFKGFVTRNEEVLVGSPQGDKAVTSTVKPFHQIVRDIPDVHLNAPCHMFVGNGCVPHLNR